MRERAKNPKAEARNPKEGRSPKAETRKKSEGSFILRDENVATSRPLQNLADRTALFGEAIIRYAKRIPRNPVNERLISQLVGAATSVGANYCEADDSISGKEFKQKIGTCRKESKETMFFLRLIATAEPTLASEARALWREAKDLRRDLEKITMIPLPYLALPFASEPLPSALGLRPSDFGFTPPRA